MSLTREQCLKWANNYPDIVQAMCHDIISDVVVEALCNRVRNETLEEAAKVCGAAIRENTVTIGTLGATEISPKLILVGASEQAEKLAAAIRARKVEK